MSLNGSVGQGGRNQPDDVRRVQSLLNDNRATPRLRADGISGKKTIAAIRAFQERVVRLRNPDGRVDPGGKTWRSLNKRTGADTRQPVLRTESSSPSDRKNYREERRKFVDPRVKENNKTTRIIDAVLPHFKGTGAKVISGYLSDSDLFWKVNYHWEYLLWMTEHCLTLTQDDNIKKKLQNIISALKGVSPKPDKGYRTSAQVGKPEDTTSMDEFNKRYRAVKQQKAEFKKVTGAANLMNKSSRPHSTFHLAAAPVAHPGTSKHSTGYALDIKGSAGTIKSIAKRAGASLVFDEKSHVHVEWKNGVNA